MAARPGLIHHWLVNALLLASLVLLGVGIFAPMMTLEKFYFFTNQVSLYSALRDLTIKGEWGLFAIIAAFSVLFPLFKLGFLFSVWNLEDRRSGSHHRHLHWLAQYGKWSMLDVFVVALLLVSVKLGMIAQVQIHYGVYAFAASVILSMLVTQWVSWRVTSGAPA